jgi:PadR family transcriptional regulator, regulatory protein PadR
MRLAGMQEERLKRPLTSIEQYTILLYAYIKCAGGANLERVLVTKEREQRDLFPGALEMMILRTVKRQPLHGYALAQHIKRTSEDLLQIEEGSLYPALQRLLKEGLVQSEWGISPRNRRVRIYRLTKAGAKHLEREVLRFEKMLEGITRVLAPG